MEIKYEGPTPEEGSYEFDPETKVATGEPFFYKGVPVQNVLRLRAVGDNGAESICIVRINQEGKWSITSPTAGRKRTRITPKFDKVKPKDVTDNDGTSRPTSAAQDLFKTSPSENP